MSSDLRIGIDFHGVITDNPLFFSDFARLAIKKGHKIHIISGGSYSELQDFLQQNDIPYTRIFSLLDYFEKRGLVKYEKTEFTVDDDLWDKAKAEYCRIHKINIQIDDTPRYANAFSTPFCLYSPDTAACDIGGQQLIFKDSPEKTLAAIENFVQQKN